MRNLIQFIIKNSFFFFFILLELFSFFLLVANNSYQRTSFISASNGFSSGILSAVSNATDYFGLRSENEILAQENAFLRSQLEESNLWSTDTFRLHNDSVKRQFYTYKSAKILSKTIQNRNNYLILNKGKADGIELEMGVISSNGVVGIVNDVSENFCSVISILHKKSAIDALITSNGYTGTISWPGIDYTVANLQNIPSHAVLRKGDTIVTSGNSTIFPPEIPIGYIQDFNLKDGQSFYDIDFRFCVDFNRIRHVYIIHNILKSELLEIKEEQDEN